MRPTNHRRRLHGGNRQTLGEWFAEIETHGTAGGRREVIQWLYDQMGRGKDVWWPTTVSRRPSPQAGITLIHGRIQTREEADGLCDAWAEAFTRLKSQLESA